MLVSPMCLQFDRFHFLGADSHYYPCCFTRVANGREEIKALLGDNFADLNAEKYSRSEILNSRGWKKLLRSFSKNPMSTCLDFCPLSNANKNWKKFDGQNVSTYYRIPRA